MPIVSYNAPMVIAAPSPIERQLREFLTHLELAKNRSPLTIGTYCFYLERFFQMMQITRPADINRHTITEYRLRLNRRTDQKGRGLSKTTQNYHLIAIRAFLRYLARQDIRALPPETVELMRLPERQVTFLQPHEVEALFAQPLKSKNPDIIKLRDRAILETLFSTGLRVSELVALKRSQVHGSSDEVSVRGKGRKVRVVFLSPSARQWMQRYAEHRKDNTPFLFIRHDRAAKSFVAEEGAPLTARSVERMISRYAQLAGISKPVTPHTMRHSYATDLLMNGADVRSVQELLGHASITTTQVYTHVTNQHLHDVHRAFHGKRRG